MFSNVSFFSFEALHSGTCINKKTEKSLLVSQQIYLKHFSAFGSLYLEHPQKSTNVQISYETFKLISRGSFYIFTC